MAVREQKVKTPRMVILSGFVSAVLLVVAVPLAARAARVSSGLQSASTVYLPIIFGAVPPSCSTAPTLAAPANGSNLNTVTPLFEWNVGNDPTVTRMFVEIGTDAAFSRYTYLFTPPPPAGVSVAQLRYPDDLGFSTTYYWRVYFDCGAKQGPYSATWSFTTAAGGGTFLPAPALIAPPDGATISSNQVTFEWSAVPGALDYRVKWMPVGSDSFWFVYTTDTHYTAVGGLTPGTQYQWVVAARNDYGDGNDSARQFTTAVTLTGVPSTVRSGGEASGCFCRQ